MYTPPFTINDEILGLVSEISEQIGALNVMLGNSMPSPVLRKENQIKTIHSSLAIEHNSLSLQQVTDIIEGKHVLGAPNEIQEVKNAVQAYQLMQQLDAFNEKDLLKAHRLMMQDLVDKSGQYRTEGVGVFDGDKCIHMAPPPQRVPELIGDLFTWLRTTDAHPLISSCVFHYEFEFIHPFLDGNGRMGRYWQTMILARWKSIFAWLPVETMVKQHQQEYYNAIARSDAAGDSTAFIQFMLKCILDTIKEESIVTDKENNIGVNVGVNVGVNERKILELLANDSSLSARKIAPQLGITQRQAERLFASLKQKNLIRRIGSDKNGYWEIL